jgi:hypothetical protein
MNRFPPVKEEGGDLGLQPSRDYHLPRLRYVRPVSKGQSQTHNDREAVNS